MTEPGTETRPSPARTWWIVALIFVTGWCLYLYLFGPKVPLGAPVLEATTGRSADYDWALNDLGGRPVRFEQYRGKAVLLNVWATWCPPCVAELPSIARLARSPRLAGVAFVCVSIDDSADTARRFVQGKGWPMTVLHTTELPEVFTTEGIPATFLIAPDGRVAASAVGSAEWDDPSVIDLLARLSGTEQKARPTSPPQPEPAPAAEAR